MTKQHMPVTASHPLELINQAIAMPSVLTTSDGRHVEVREWEASIEQGDPITVECQGIIADSPSEDLPRYLRDGPRAFMIKSWSHSRDRPMAEQSPRAKTLKVYFSALVALPMEMTSSPYPTNVESCSGLQ